VEATFLRTEKRLKKEPEWRTAYSTQVHEMVERRAAKKLTRETIADWKGPVWYVSHLVAPNPNSVTTPVRLVWNSSQKFRGISMNDLLLKGPDVLNPIRAVLLRFRRGVHAALGDIKKMYNSVWLENLEMHLHRFLWRNSEDEEIEEFAITRVNMGDRPAGCIAQLAMRETARLPMFTHLEEERRVLEDSYVDDILTSHNDLEKLDRITKKVEEILKAGGFFLKPWVRSGQKPDKLYLTTSINFSKRKKKMRIGQNLVEEEVRRKTPNPLTRRQLLSQVASLYDPIGLATPAKQKGAILVRKAFQETGGKNLLRDTWDTPLSERLREEAIHLFEEYTRLNQITFHRSLTPVRRIGEPWGITFSDGSDQSYGAVAYFRWETKQGILVRLIESKAKLTPLDQKGEAVKAEVCGAVFAARLRKYIEKHSRIQVKRWLHLLDSQTVLGAIQRDSYGYQTFFANRVGEIQKSTSVGDWRWIPGEQNIADLVTRGATPEDLKENSVWQNGPEFLKQPVEEWPTKSAKD
uniref:Reverse transcriptase domain-containing protein n=1 Tax=Gasterosteus aculeatus TaxID=69293 RepID=G3Q1I0_GASAC